MEAEPRSVEFPDGVDGFDVRTTFLVLTRNTTPHGFEWKQFDTLLTESGFTLDKAANYQGIIMKPDGTMPRTVFIAHLDTADEVPPRRVEHVFEGDTVKTDGNSILGADDKAGVTVLLYLIHKQVPGFYIFTWGEERGRLGSRAIASKYSFANFDRAIAFDRKGKRSVITKQSGQTSCSNEFADALIDQLAQHGLRMEKDDTGSFTDTVSFFGEVPECTNISTGYLNAHTSAEEQDLGFLEHLCYAAGRVDWESLPVHQDTKKRYTYTYTPPKGGGGGYYDGYGYNRGQYDPNAYKYTPPAKGETVTTPPKESSKSDTVPTTETPRKRTRAEKKAHPLTSTDDRRPPWKAPDRDAELAAAQETWDTLTSLNDHRSLSADLVEQFVFEWPEYASHALFSLIVANPYAARSHAITEPDTEWN